MNAPADLEPIETLEQYHSYIGELEIFMRGDPAADTPEGRRLLALAEAIEVFERKEWAAMFPEAPRDNASAPGGE